MDFFLVKIQPSSSGRRFCALWIAWKKSRVAKKTICSRTFTAESVVWCLLGACNGEGKGCVMPAGVSERVAGSAHTLSAPLRRENMRRGAVPINCWYLIKAAFTVVGCCWKWRDVLLKRLESAQQRAVCIGLVTFLVQQMTCKGTPGVGGWAREVRDLIKVRTMGADVSKDFDLSAWCEKENRKERKRSQVNIARTKRVATLPLCQETI